MLVESGSPFLHAVFDITKTEWDEYVQESGYNPQTKTVDEQKAQLNSLYGEMKVLKKQARDLKEYLTFGRQTRRRIKLFQDLSRLSSLL